jgi:RNA polymerase sigma-32 factor
LLRAVEKFDLSKGRLSTYAIWWIKAYMTDFIINSWSLVKKGTLLARKKLFFSLGKIKKQLGIRDFNMIIKYNIKTQLINLVITKDY